MVINVTDHLIYSWADEHMNGHTSSTIEVYICCALCELQSPLRYAFSRRAWHATDIEPHVEAKPRAAGRRGPTPTWQAARGTAVDSWPRPPETGPPHAGAVKASYVSSSYLRQA